MIRVWTVVLSAILVLYGTEIIMGKRKRPNYEIKANKKRSNWIWSQRKAM